MSCGGERFSPAGAYDYAWDSVKPMKGKYNINYIQYQGVRCAAMSCGGERFSPAGAYDYAWDSVKPMKGKYTINYIQYPFRRWVCLLAQGLDQQLSNLKGMGRSAVCAATQVQICGETVELPQLHLLAAWLQYTGLVVDVPVVWGMRSSSSTR